MYINVLYSIKFLINLDYLTQMDSQKHEDGNFLRLVGDRVRECRKSLGLTQEELAELASIHLTYVSHIESGKANASICVYRRISAALRMPLVQLVDVDLKRIERDELMKAVVEIKKLGKKEQKLILQAVKGLIAGVKD